jgi:hypothetical protein
MVAILWTPPLPLTWALQGKKGVQKKVSKIKGARGRQKGNAMSTLANIAGALASRSASCMVNIDEQTGVSRGGLMGVLLKQGMVPRLGEMIADVNQARSSVQHFHRGGDCFACTWLGACELTLVA